MGFSVGARNSFMRPPISGVEGGEGGERAKRHHHHHHHHHHAHRHPAVQAHNGQSSFEGEDSGSRTGGVRSGSPSSSGAPVSGASSSSGPMPSGNMGQWIQQAMTALQQAGVDTSKINPQDLMTIIQHESGGNPNAQNNWDSNAAAGHPSIGLMQTIQPTFDQYALSGHNDIHNPVDNIIAGVRYAIARYGSVGNVPGVRAVNNGGAYVGY